MLNVPKQVGGYISQRLSDDSPYLQTERNTINFMFLTEAKDGVIFYMGRDKDHFLVELVNGSLRVEADFGGGKMEASSIKLQFHKHETPRNT